MEAKYPKISKLTSAYNVTRMLSPVMSCLKRGFGFALLLHEC